MMPYINPNRENYKQESSEQKLEPNPQRKKNSKSKYTNREEYLKTSERRELGTVFVTQLSLLTKDTRKNSSLLLVVEEQEELMLNNRNLKNLFGEGEKEKGNKPKNGFV